MPRLEDGVVEGPYNVTGVSDTPTRERVFVCRPATRGRRAGVRRADPVHARATRVPPSRRRATTSRRRSRSITTRAPNGGDFDGGIRAAVSRMLVSPWFLFRVEGDSPDVPAGSNHAVSDFELASRLSFFLWSTSPTTSCSTLAENGELREREHARGAGAPHARGLALRRDDRELRRPVAAAAQPRVARQAGLPAVPGFRRQPAQGIPPRDRAAVRERAARRAARSTSSSTANYTFVNERLARHYGIKGVYGARFRKVDVTDPNRYGLFGHGSLLALTSVSSRTSPIIRGKFIVDGVLEQSAAGSAGRRSGARGERAEGSAVDGARAARAAPREPDLRGVPQQHRSGRLRARELRRRRQLARRDARGPRRSTRRASCSTARPSMGPIAAARGLLADPELFASTVTEKMLIYALGRGLEPADMPVVRQIVRNAAEHDYSLVSIVLGIVDSYPFQNADEWRRCRRRRRSRKRGSSQCSSRRSIWIAGRSCEVRSAQQSPCRCSTRWCRRRLHRR